MGAYPLLIPDQPIIFFDSSCLLCNRAVQIILRIDKKEVFIFSSLSSDIGRYILGKYDINEDSIILYQQGNCKVKSNAFLTIFKRLRFPYSLMSVFYIIPKFIRDWVYDFIARKRKKWFGTTDHCLIDSHKFKERIIL